jgi:caffeoyl-CoA O-methyltransferase
MRSSLDGGEAVAASAPRPVTPAAILAELLGQLSAQLDGIDPSARALLADVCELASGLDPYLERSSTPESLALARLAARTHAADWGQPTAPGQLEQEMLSGHVEGQFLKMLIHATRAVNVLEIGMFTGYSALAMAEALPAHGRVIACEIDADVADFAQRSFDAAADGHKIDVRVGPAMHTLAHVAEAGDMFDLIFIDADKAGYRSYLETILDADLLAPHGLICVDNTLMQGEPWTSGSSSANGVAIAEFNEAVAADARIEQVIVPLRDGLTLIRRVTNPLDDDRRGQACGARS